MHAHTPPFTKPTGAYDARKLREETIAIAQSQDRDNDCLVSILAAWRAVRKQQDDVYARLMKLAERAPLPERYDLRQGEPKTAEVKPDAYRDALDSISAATHENPPKWSPEWAKANSSLHWVNPEPQVVCAGSPQTRLPEWAKEVGNADAAHIELTPEWTVEHKDGAEYWHKRTPNCDGLTARDIRAPHPMQAEAIRDHDERLNGAEDRL